MDVHSHGVASCLIDPFSDSSIVFGLFKPLKKRHAMMMKSERAKGDLAKEQGAREEYHQRKNIFGGECPTGGRAEGADSP